VRAQNERSLKVLENDARFKGYYDAALKISTSKPSAFPTARSAGGYVYNFWQDDAHERGIWRRSRWPTMPPARRRGRRCSIIDALAKAEGANWVYKGVSCRRRRMSDCLLSLSDGGKDAVRVREYSTSRKGVYGRLQGQRVRHARSQAAPSPGRQGHAPARHRLGGDESTMTERAIPSS
jgi:prolyl oligopeptidase